MASGRITLSYTTTNNGETSATVSVTMTYYGNGQTYQSTPSSNNCYITLPGYGTKYFTHAYTKSTAAQEMGSVEFTISKTHSAQSLTATGGITNYSTVYSNPTGSCTISVSAKASHTISYKANGHGTAPAAQTKWYGEGLVLQPAMSATGWTFIGWNIYATSTTARYNASGYYTEDDADATLYGIWQKDITLSYNANSGSGAPMSQTNTIYNTTTSTSFIIPSTPPTRTNYDFLGWLDGSTLYQPGDTISNVTDSKELVASWKLAYIASTISDISAVRCDSDGTSNDEGTHGKLTFKVSKYSNGSKQSYPTVSAKYDTNRKITLSYKEEENNIRTYTSNPHFSLTGDNQHNIVITKQDGSYGTKTFSTYISAKFFTIDITADGKGIGLLTTAPDNGIVVGGNLTLHKSSGNSPSLIFQRGTLTDNYNDWQIYNKGGWLYFGHRGLNSSDWLDTQEWSISTGGKFSGYIDWTNVTDKPDYITNQGTVTESTNGSGLWRYRKWNSGFQEVWYRGSVDFTDATSNSANGWYRRIKTFAIPYSSMTNITAFDDNAIPVVTGAYSGTLLSTGGFKSSGTAVELQEISGATISSTSITGWSIYIAGMPR